MVDDVTSTQDIVSVADELLFSVLAGDVRAVQQLLDAGASASHVSELWATSALHAACQTGQVDLVKIMVDGSNVNSRDSHGRPPIVLACHTLLALVARKAVKVNMGSAHKLVDRQDIRSLLDTVVVLKQAGADMNLQRIMRFRVTEIKTAETPWEKEDWSEKPVGLTAKEALASAMGLVGSAWEVVCTRHAMSLAEVLALNQQLGLDVDIRECDVSGRTLLMAAADVGDVQSVQLLVERRCEVETRDFRGKSALHYACRRGHCEVANILLDFGPSMAAEKDCCNRTALHVFNFNPSTASNSEWRRTLLRLAAAASSSPDIYGWTPAHFCAAHGSSEAMAVLAESLVGFDLMADESIATGAIPFMRLPNSKVVRSLDARFSDRRGGTRGPETGEVRAKRRVRGSGSTRGMRPRTVWEVAIARGERAMLEWMCEHALDRLFPRGGPGDAQSFAASCRIAAAMLALDADSIPPSAAAAAWKTLKTAPQVTWPPAMGSAAVRAVTDAGDERLAILGMPLLSALSAQGNAELVSLALDCGANPSGGSGGLIAPLFMACRDANVDVVQVLLQRGASVDVWVAGRWIDDPDATTLKLPELWGELQWVWTGAESAERPQTSAEIQTSLLFYSVARACCLARSRSRAETNRRLTIVELLLEHGAPAKRGIESSTGHANSALHLLLRSLPERRSRVGTADFQRKEEIARRLMQQGAVDEVDGAGETSLQVAVKRGSTASAIALVNSPEGPVEVAKAMTDTIVAGDTKVLAAMLAKHLDEGVTAVDGESLLELALQHRRFAVAAMLITRAWARVDESGELSPRAVAQELLLVCDARERLCKSNRGRDLRPDVGLCARVGLELSLGQLRMLWGRWEHLRSLLEEAVVSGSRRNAQVIGKTSPDSFNAFAAVVQKIVEATWKESWAAGLGQRLDWLVDPQRPLLDLRVILAVITAVDATLDAPIVRQEHGPSPLTVAAAAITGDISLLREIHARSGSLEGFLPCDVLNGSATMQPEEANADRAAASEMERALLAGSMKRLGYILQSAGKELRVEASALALALVHRQLGAVECMLEESCPCAIAVRHRGSGATTSALHLLLTAVPPLHRGVRSDVEERWDAAARKMVELGAPDEVDANGNSTLALAVRNGFHAAAMALAERREPTAVGKVSALLCAVEAGDVPVVRALLEKVGDVREEGVALLEAALKSRRPREVAEALHAGLRAAEGVMLLAGCGCSDTFLQQWGAMTQTDQAAAVRARDGRGRSLMMHAVCGRLTAAAVDALLQLGTDDLWDEGALEYTIPAGTARGSWHQGPRKVSKQMHPLLLAADFGFEDAALQLLKAVPKPLSVRADWLGSRSILRIAAGRGLLRLVRELLSTELGMDPKDVESLQAQDATLEKDESDETDEEEEGGGKAGLAESVADCFGFCGRPEGWVLLAEFALDQELSPVTETQAEVRPHRGSASDVLDWLPILRVHTTNWNRPLSLNKPWADGLFDAVVPSLVLNRSIGFLDAIETILCNAEEWFAVATVRWLLGTDIVKFPDAIVIRQLHSACDATAAAVLHTVIEAKTLLSVDEQMELLPLLTRAAARSQSKPAELLIQLLHAGIASEKNEGPVIESNQCEVLMLRFTRADKDFLRSWVAQALPIPDALRQPLSAWLEHDDAVPWLHEWDWGQVIADLFGITVDAYLGIDAEERATAKRAWEATMSEREKGWVYDTELSETRWPKTEVVYSCDPQSLSAPASGHTLCMLPNTAQAGLQIRMQAVTRRNVDSLVTGLLKASGTSIVDLDLTSSNLGCNGTEKLSAAGALDRVVFLSLADNQIGPHGAEMLAKALPPCLRLLDLDKNQLCDAGVTSLSEALSRCPSLSSLSVGDTACGPAGATALAAALPRAVALAHLGVESNLLEDGGCASLAAAMVRAVQNGVLVSARIFAQDASDFAVGYTNHHTPLVPLLSHECAAAEGAGEDGTQLLLALLGARLRPAEIIHLSCMVGDVGVGSLARALGVHRTARELCVTDAGISGQSFATLHARILSCDCLATIDLSGNPIGGDALAESLPELMRIRTLRDLRLRNVGIDDDEGAGKVARSLAGSAPFEIKHLDLGGNFRACLPDVSAGRRLGVEAGGLMEVCRLVASNVFANLQSLRIDSSIRVDVLRKAVSPLLLERFSALDMRFVGCLLSASPALSQVAMGRCIKLPQSIECLEGLRTCSSLKKLVCPNWDVELRKDRWRSLYDLTTKWRVEWTRHLASAGTAMTAAKNPTFKPDTRKLLWMLSAPSKQHAAPRPRPRRGQHYGAMRASLDASQQPPRLEMGEIDLTTGTVLELSETYQSEHRAVLEASILSMNTCLEALTLGGSLLKKAGPHLFRALALLPSLCKLDDKALNPAHCRSLDLAGYLSSSSIPMDTRSKGGFAARLGFVASVLARCSSLSSLSLASNRLGAQLKELQVIEAELIEAEEKERRRLISKLESKTRGSPGCRRNPLAVETYLAGAMAKAGWQLHHLDVSNNDLASEQLDAMIGHPGVTSSVQSLTLSGNEVRWDSGLELGRLGGMWSGLRELRLTGCKMQGFGVLTDVLMSNSVLKCLDVSNNSLGAQEWTHFGPLLQTMSSLEQLFIGQNPIGDAGIHVVADSLSACSCLHTLEMTHSLVTQAGAIAVASVVQQLTALTALNNLRLGNDPGAWELLGSGVAAADTQSVSGSAGETKDASDINAYEMLLLALRMSQLSAADQLKVPGLQALRVAPTLDLKGARLREAPHGLHLLTHLTALDISYNRLDKLPLSQLCDIQSLRSLECSKNPRLVSPPPEICQQGPVRTIQFVRQAYSERGGANTEMLLVAIGDGESGKTSVINALMSVEDKSVRIHEDARTVGIDIRTWPISGQQELTFHILDLAGQAVYGMGHQFFLVRRGIYVLVWRVRESANKLLVASMKDLRRMVHHWMDSLQLRVPGATMVLVATHIDCANSEEELDAQTEFVRRTVQHKLKALEAAADVSEILPLKVLHDGESFRVNCLEGQGVAQLRSSLIRLTLALPWYEEHLPLSYLELRKNIASELRAGKTWINWETYWRKAKDLGMDELDTKIATSFLHEIGTLKYFGDAGEAMAKTSRGELLSLLQDTLFVSSRWIIDSLKGLIRHDREALLSFFGRDDTQDRGKWLRRVQRLSTFGIMHAELVPFVWPSIDSSARFWQWAKAQDREGALWDGNVATTEEDYERVLALLKGCDIIHDLGGSEYVAPGLLSVSQQQRVDARAYADSGCPLRKTVIYSALPPGFLERAIVRCRHRSSHMDFTSTSAAFYNKGFKAQIFLHAAKTDAETPRMELTMRASSRSLMSMMDEEVGVVENFFPGLARVESVEQEEPEHAEPCQVMMLLGSGSFRAAAAAGSIADLLRTMSGSDERSGGLALSVGLPCTPMVWDQQLVKGLLATIVREALRRASQQALALTEMQMTLRSYTQGSDMLDLLLAEKTEGVAQLVVGSVGAPAWWGVLHWAGSSHRAVESVGKVLQLITECSDRPSSETAKNVLQMLKQTGHACEEAATCVGDVKIETEELEAAQALAEWCEILEAGWAAREELQTAAQGLVPVFETHFPGSGGPGRWEEELEKSAADFEKFKAVMGGMHAAWKDWVQARQSAMRTTTKVELEAQQVKAQQELVLATKQVEARNEDLQEARAQFDETHARIEEIDPELNQRAEEMLLLEKEIQQALKQIRKREWRYLHSFQNNREVQSYNMNLVVDALALLLKRRVRKFAMKPVGSSIDTGEPGEIVAYHESFKSLLSKPDPSEPYDAIYKKEPLDTILENLKVESLTGEDLELILPYAESHKLRKLTSVFGSLRGVSAGQGLLSWLKAVAKWGQMATRELREVRCVHVEREWRREAVNAAEKECARVRAKQEAAARRLRQAEEELKVCLHVLDVALVDEQRLASSREAWLTEAASAYFAEVQHLGSKHDLWKNMPAVPRDQDLAAMVSHLVARGTDRRRWMDGVAWQPRHTQELLLLSARTEHKSGSLAQTCAWERVTEACGRLQLAKAAWGEAEKAARSRLEGVRLSEWGATLAKAATRPYQGGASGGLLAECAQLLQQDSVMDDSVNARGASGAVKGVLEASGGELSAKTWDGGRSRDVVGMVGVLRRLASIPAEMKRMGQQLGECKEILDRAAGRVQSALTKWEEMTGAELSAEQVEKEVEQFQTPWWSDGLGASGLDSGLKIEQLPACLQRLAEEEVGHSRVLEEWEWDRQDFLSAPAIEQTTRLTARAIWAGSPEALNAAVHVVLDQGLSPAQSVLSWREFKNVDCFELCKHTDAGKEKVELLKRLVGDDAVLLSHLQPSAKHQALIPSSVDRVKELMSGESKEELAAAVENGTIQSFQDLKGVMSTGQVISDAAALQEAVAKVEAEPLDGKEWRVLVVCIDSTLAVDKDAVAIFKALAAKRKPLIPLIFPGYDISDYSNWWPPELSELAHHALFVDCRQPSSWSSKVQFELLPQVNKFLEEWRGEAAEVQGELLTRVPCQECVTSGEGEPDMLDRNKCVEAYEEWMMQKLQQLQRSGSAAAAGSGMQLWDEKEENAVTIECAKGHRVPVKQMLSKAAIFDAVQCPQCMAHGAAPPFCFDRKQCLLYFSEDNTGRVGAMECQTCLAAGRPASIRILDMISPEVFISYNWGVWTGRPDGEGEYSTQALVKPLTRRLEDEIDVVCWFDVGGGMGAGQDHKMEMEEGVRKCTVVLIFLADAYLNSFNCQREFAHAVAKCKHIIPVLVPDAGMTRYGSSGWTGPGPEDPDWWKHACNKCTSKMHPDSNHPLPWSVLKNFPPVDLRAPGQALPASAGELEIWRRISSRFHRGEHIAHRTERSYGSWARARVKVRQMIMAGRVLGAASENTAVA